MLAPNVCDGGLGEVIPFEMLIQTVLQDRNVFFPIMRRHGMILTSCRQSRYTLEDEINLSTEEN
jgi:hypothetical protein